MDKSVAAVRIPNLGKDNISGEFVFRGVRVSYRKIITAQEVGKVIDNIIACCYDENKSVFLYEIFDVAFRSNIIAAYTNIELPDNIDEVINAVYISGLYSLVMENICAEQVDFIMLSARNYITESK